MATERMLVWEGVSQLDGVTPIVALATGVPTKSTSKAKRSNNAKTGDMIQIHILLRDVNPTEAIKQGLDTAICHDCPHRSKASGGSGGCYTHNNILRGFAQASTWKAHRAKGSVPFDVERFHGQRVRFGAYGDPAAVPVEIWRKISEVAEGVTSYTHQWRTADRGFQEFSMASTDSIRERRQAREQGWRNFWVIPEGSARPEGTITCPASKEAGYKTQCADCMMCSGTSAKQSRDIVIQAHGSAAKRVNQLGSEAADAPAIALGRSLPLTVV